MTDLLDDDTEHDHGCKRLIKLPPTWEVYATFDGPGNCLRYSLTHIWDRMLPAALVGMMNPSGADTRFGDSTVMKTARIFMRLGFGSQIVVNACAHRGVSPKMLLQTKDPVGPDNLRTIADLAGRASLLVIAHGNLPGGLQKHADAMVAVLRATGKPLHVFGLSQSGVPKHPLARGRNLVPENVVPQLWGQA
jgi:hypothetical protein